MSIHELASSDRKVWSHAAVVFATIYTALISINYYVQLAWVGPRLAADRTAGIEQYLFVPFDSFLYAVDILGYSFMSVAALFAAMVFTGKGIERVARRFLIANGLLLPFIALQMYWHGLIWIAALWLVTFPGSTWSVALVFAAHQRQRRVLRRLEAAFTEGEQNTSKEFTRCAGKRLQSVLANVGPFRATTLLPVL